MGINVTLSWPDYVVAVLCLAISAGIGVFFRFAGGRQNSTEEFLMADRQMSVFPVALSLLASFVSAITVIGTPPETYVHGTQYMLLAVANFFVMPIAAHLYIPVLYRLRLTSAYEYLELRFDRLVRTTASIVFSFWMIVYMSVVLYSPCLALSAVTGLNLWMLIAVTGIICVFYTTLGGMKAVMWTDAFQILVMYSGIVAFLVLGSSNEGGWSAAWSVAEERRRVEFGNVNPSPLDRHTVWSLLIGGAYTWLVIYAINQSQVQRCLASPTLRAAQVAMWLNVPGLAMFLILAALCGILALARYRDCDPLAGGMISKIDQLFPLYVMDVLSAYRGLAGLIIACICSASLSTISSGLNSLAAVLLQDVVRSYIRPNITDSGATKFSKVVCVVYGALVMLLTWVASKLGSILTVALALHGGIGGPLLGVFTLGIFLPWANAAGALAGLLSGVGITMWIIIGAQVYPAPVKKLCVSTTGCDEFAEFTVLEPNYTIPKLTCNASSMVRYPDLDDYEGLVIYRISYIWYSFLAVIVVLVVGGVVSAIFGFNSPNDVDERLVSPLYHFCCAKLPERWRERCRCRKAEGKGEGEGEVKTEIEEAEEKL